MKGSLLEVFSSYQGEGPFAGARQIFVRLGGCHLRCSYCDTPESWERKSSWVAEMEPESRQFEQRHNPADASEVLELLDRFRQHRRYHSVSFTGGEPLLQPEFLRALMLGARERELPVYLDTSGTLPDRLERVLDLVDFFAFDIKLPGCPGVHMMWEEPQKCLEMVRGKSAFVKIVVMQDSHEDEIARAASIVPAGMPLILQPVTPVNERTVPPDGAVLARFRAACRRDVLVLPQIHRLVGWK